MTTSDECTWLTYACEHGKLLIDPCDACPTNPWHVKYGPFVMRGTLEHLESECRREREAPASQHRHPACWAWIRDAGITHCPKCKDRMGACAYDCPFRMLDSRIKRRAMAMHPGLEPYLRASRLFGFNSQYRYCALFLGVKFPHGYRSPMEDPPGELESLAVRP